MQFILLRKFDQWVTRQVSLPDDTPEVRQRNKNYYTGAFFIPSVVLLLTILCWSLDLPIMMYCGLELVLVGLILILIMPKFLRKMRLIVFLNHTNGILVTSGTILLLGGITHSGGMIFCGLIIILYTMVFQDIKILWWCISLYVFTFILEAVLQPYLTPAPEMTEGKNLLMFVINTLWMTATILWLIYYVFGKEAELARLKAQRLKELDDFKTRFFANIAHEFRTPLTLITGMAELMCENPHQQIRERTEIIQRNTNKILRLVDQMLNLARIEAGSMPLHNVQSDIAAFLRYVFNSFKGLSEYRQVRLHLLSEGTGFMMDFDPEKLEDVISNLLSNALKYTPAGGDVYLHFHASGGQPEQFIVIVKDTGIGIPSDKLGYIFDRFYRVENEYKHYEEGSGIGLTLVREYVNLMNGEIKVESNPGQGTEFTLMLPVTRTSPVKETLILSSEPPVSPDQVDFNLIDSGYEDSSHPELLVIEDNPEVIQYLQLILGQKFRLRSANNGEEGIRQAFEHLPDLILSDVMMPGKDGYEVCRTLKKDFRTCHIPIVLLTARADTASRISGLEQGADAYLTKPFNKRELLACLRNQFVQREKLRIKYSSLHSAQEPEATPGINELFLKNVSFILEKNHAQESFSIEELCSALGISRVQLHRKLIALTGQSASHFIRSFRLEKAREMLQTTTKSVSEIAYETGFSDANYFSRVFSQEFGLPPSGHRKGSEIVV